MAVRDLREYARYRLADDAPDAMSDTDTTARLGRAPAVTLVAATQRPTQKVMGQGAVRSQMNIRIAFRVEDQRDVDLILGQGKLKVGWHAHKLNAPGKLLISSPEHETPRRVRAYLVTGDDGKCWQSSRSVSCCTPLGGCDQPAAACEVHHLRHRKDGGPTSVTDCALFCFFHHHVVIHQWGWTVVLNPDGTTTAWNKDKTKIIHSHSPPAPGDPGA